MDRRQFAEVLGGLVASPALHYAGTRTAQSTFRIAHDGDGPGRNLVQLAWRTRAGLPVGEVSIPVTSPVTEEGSKGRIGPLALRLPALGSVPNAFEWDTREWQWWKGYPRPFGGRNDEYTRLVPATGGAEHRPEGVRVWSEYESDSVRTTQEWLFADLEPDGPIFYDCLITIRNNREAALAEYGQFFATYVAWNEKKGHFYWSEDGGLVNYLDRGAKHLDYFVTARGSSYEKMGRVPHCARGGGKIQALWRKPVSVSVAGPGGLHHVQMTEEGVTAAIGMGGSGYAQDYILSPPGMVLAPGAGFRAHIRHLFGAPKNGDWATTLASWWRRFEADHRQVHGISRIREGAS